MSKPRFLIETVEFNENFALNPSATLANWSLYLSWLFFGD
jgi:hypothetical protein